MISEKVKKDSKKFMRSIGIINEKLERCTNLHVKIFDCKSSALLNGSYIDVTFEKLVPDSGNGYKHVMSMQFRTYDKALDFTIDYIRSLEKQGFVGGIYQERRKSNTH
jgi:hypothetical protein